MPGRWPYRAGRLLVVSFATLLAGLGLPALAQPPLQELTRPPAPQETQQPVPSPVLRGNVANITLTKGRSQLLKFVRPIVRVSIADPAVADVVLLSPDEVMVNGKQRGVTSLLVWDRNGQEGAFDLTVNNETSELMQAIRSVAPEERVDIRITDDSLVLTGKVSDAVVVDQIRQVAGAYGYRDKAFVDLTHAPSSQVLLKVRVVEASREVSRVIRSTFGSIGDQLLLTRIPSPRDMGSIFTRISGNTAVGGQGGNSDQGTTFPYRTGSLVGAYLPSWNEDLLAVWELMEQRGKISTLAEPNLVVTHGRQASFLAGGEFPYVTGISPQGVPQVAFKEYGVKLTFTPWLAPNSNRIELQVAPEVSAIDRSNCIATGNVNLCGITKRNAGSTVSLRNGEMLVIAGILNKEDQDLFQKIPWVGDLPLIGRLFKNSETTRNQRELLVFVSPTILPATEGPTAAPATPPVWPVSSPSGPATLKKETSNTNHMK